MSRHIALVAVGTLSVSAVACGGPNDETLTSPVATPAESAATTVEPATTTESTGASTSAEATTTLPGDPVDWMIAGTVAQVAGVAWDETFVIRTLPGEDQPTAASLPPLTDLVLTGNGRDLDDDGTVVTWAEVTAGDVTGWISYWSLVYLGAARDVTSEAIAAFGQVPTAPTMLELGTIVMDELAPLDPESAGARIVRATDPSTGPTSDVVYDEFPGEKYGDDAAVGARYRIVGRQVPTTDLPATGFASPLEYELVSVEVRSLCSRGVDTSSGFCV